MRFCTENVQDLERISIPVTKLVHVTHKREAAKIKKRSTYRFKPYTKVARHGRTAKTKLVDLVANGPSEPMDGAIMPGLYSWWSVYPDQPRKFQDAVCALKHRDLNVHIPDYLERKSGYGNKAFVCNFNDLLTSYVSARSLESERSIRDIRIRKGGTLLYRYEICYVLIVCLTDDDATLKRHKSLAEGDEPYRSNGFLRRQGRVNVDSETRHPLIFNPKHNVTWVNGESYNYETPAFAFYFPNSTDSLEVGHELCSTTNFTHDKQRCLKKKGRKCPNNLK